MSAWLAGVVPGLIGLGQIEQALGGPRLVVAWLVAQAVRTSVILAIALVMVVLLRRRSAALRHWLLAAAIGCAWAMPLFGAMVPAWSLSDVWAMSRAAAAPATRADLHREEVAAFAGGGSAADTRTLAVAFAEWRGLGAALDLPHRAAREAQRLPAAAMTTIIAIWFAGVLIALTPLLAGYARLWTIARQSRRVGRGRWRAMADAVARELELRRPIALLRLRSRHPSLLVTWGLVHPRVLLPASAARWPDHTLRVVLLHELAHAKRGDWAIQMAAELLRGLCWFNPLAWIACRRLRRESELACDDAVMGRGIERTDYAAQVLDVARMLGHRRPPLAATTSATAMAHPSGLERRIRIMLNDRLNRAPLTRSARLATALALIAIALPLAGFGAAHQNQGAIAGTVVDQNGAPVPDAAIVLRPAGGEVRTFAPDANGRFDADSLPAGQYRIEVIAMGFAPLQESVTLSPDQRIERRFSLPLGSLEETIVVSGASLSSTTTTRPEAQLQRDRTRWAATPLQPPIMVTHVRPEYPARLHDAGVQGVVTLQAQIGVDGAITNVSTVSAPQPELAEVARAAVQQWRYEPTRLHGVPVETRIKIVIEFTL